MNLTHEKQVDNTLRKIAILEEQLRIARTRPRSPENDQSIDSLVQMLGQMREEVAVYRSRTRKCAS